MAAISVGFTVVLVCIKKKKITVSLNFQGNLKQLFYIRIPDLKASVLPPVHEGL